MTDATRAELIEDRKTSGRVTPADELDRTPLSDVEREVLRTMLRVARNSRDGYEHARELAEQAEQTRSDAERSATLLGEYKALALAGGLNVPEIEYQLNHVMRKG